MHPTTVAQNNTCSHLTILTPLLSMPCQRWQTLHHLLCDVGALYQKDASEMNASNSAWKHMPRCATKPPLPTAYVWRDRYPKMLCKVLLSEEHQAKQKQKIKITKSESDNVGKQRIYIPLPLCGHAPKNKVYISAHLQIGENKPCKSTLKNMNSWISF